MSIQRPVIAYHLILTAYGFWLPNDPRGSGSSQVWSDALQPFGPATKVATQQSVARVAHDGQLRRAAKNALQQRPVRFDGSQAHAIALGFGSYLRRHRIHCRACAVLPDHAHLVLDRSPALIERIAIGLKAASVHSLLEKECIRIRTQSPSSARKSGRAAHVILSCLIKSTCAVRFGMSNKIRSAPVYVSNDGLSSTSLSRERSERQDAWTLTSFEAQRIGLRTRLV